MFSAQKSHIQWICASDAVAATTQSGCLCVGAEEERAAASRALGVAVDRAVGARRARAVQARALLDLEDSQVSICPL